MNYKDRKFIELEKESSLPTLKRSLASCYNKSDSMNSYELTLNKIKSDTGVECNDLVYYLDKIEKINNNMFEESNKLINDIDEMELKILKLQSKKINRKAPLPSTLNSPNRVRQLEDSLQGFCCKTDN